MPFANMMMKKPISPMSCVSGIHDSGTSPAPKRAASLAPRALARMLAWVSTTPFGSLVEPEENWMKAGSCGDASAGRPGRPMSSMSSTRKLRAARACRVPASPPPAANWPSRASGLRSG